MSQYNSRIHIKVAGPSVWGKFKGVDDAEFDLAALAEEGCTSFVLDDWCCVEDELLGIVSALAEIEGVKGRAEKTIIRAIRSDNDFLLNFFTEMFIRKTS